MDILSETREKEGHASPQPQLSIQKPIVPGPECQRDGDRRDALSDLPGELGSEICLLEDVAMQTRVPVAQVETARRHRICRARHSCCGSSGNSLQAGRRLHRLQLNKHVEIRVRGNSRRRCSCDDRNNPRR